MQEFEEYCNIFQNYMTANVELELERNKFDGFDFSWHYSSEINRVDRLRNEAEEAFINLVKATITNLSGE